MEYVYYVLENGSSTDKQKLKTGTHILRVPSQFDFKLTDGNGPYKSLRAIKKYSPIYDSLKKSNLKRAQQIVLEKNIFTASKAVLVPSGTEFKEESIDAVIHSTIGRIKNGNLTGIHFYDPDRVRLLEILETNLITNVFRARFEFYDLKKSKWIEKRSSSTFFPKHWNLSTLLMECKFALDQLKTENFNDGKFKAKTSNNIEIEIVIKGGKLRSLYPLI